MVEIALLPARALGNSPHPSQGAGGEQRAFVQIYLILTLYFRSPLISPGKVSAGKSEFREGRYNGVGWRGGDRES